MPPLVRDDSHGHGLGDQNATAANTKKPVPVEEGFHWDDSMAAPLLAPAQANTPASDT
jgi:hypothetical protein